MLLGRLADHATASRTHSTPTSKLPECSERRSQDIRLHQRREEERDPLAQYQALFERWNWARSISSSTRAKSAAREECTSMAYRFFATQCLDSSCSVYLELPSRSPRWYHRPARSSGVYIPPYTPPYTPPDGHHW